MVQGATVSFTISHDGAKLKPARSFTLKSGSDAAVRIGRARGNDIVLDHRGASQYHCELRLLPDDDGGGGHWLHVRDLSMNGTGMRKAEGRQPECLAKHNKRPVPNGAVLLVPMMLKAPSTPADRALLKVDFQDPEKRPPAGQRQEAPAAEQQSDEPAPPASGPAANDGGASGQEENDAAEKDCMQSVDILLKTRDEQDKTGDAPCSEAKMLKPLLPADEAAHTSNVATLSSTIPPLQTTEDEAGDAPCLDGKMPKLVLSADEGAHTSNVATSSSALPPLQTAEELGHVPPSPERQQLEGCVTDPRCPAKRSRSQSLVREPPRRRLRRQWPVAAVVEDKSMQFATGAESCSICCTEYAEGSKMVRLACTHGWYCLDCMARFAQSRLEVGAVELTCPECSNIIAEHDLRKMVPAEMVERLLQRSLERAVSCDANLKACPTPGCMMRVALEDGSSGYFLCPLCKKTSCVRCGVQPWHKKSSCEEYAKKPRLTTTSKGRCNSAAAAAAAMAAESNEEALRKWMAETGTRQCPTCGMAVSKQNLGQQQTQRSECHKMMCRNCNCRFCFKCLAILTASFSCGCTSELHGFINPKSGRRISHTLRPGGNSKKRGAVVQS